MTDSTNSDNLKSQDSRNSKNSKNSKPEKNSKKVKVFLKCSTCGAESPEDYNFCELDGTPLKQRPVAEHLPLTVSICKCNFVAQGFDENAFCLACGLPWQARNRVERRLNANLAAITDRGLEHHLNEDDVRIAIETNNGEHYSVMVVCDGLSSAQRSREASTKAAEATLAFLVESIRYGFTDPQLAMSEAIMAAHAAVCQIEFLPDQGKDPPGTTIVAAVLGPTLATIGWVGDSRAYLVSAGGAKLLTHDHSWVNQAVDQGLLTELEASKSPNAHVITHCLGPIETAVTGVLPQPAIVSVDPQAADVLILCSDGLWNYAERLEEFGAVSAAAVGLTDEGDDALAMAKHLVAFALSKGGRDNITVAIAAHDAW